jgi:tetratricopeptide (TPR) repeat protein
LDPAYALAYAGLADAYAVLGSWEAGVIPPKEAALKARAAASRALDIDGSLAEAHPSLACINLHYDWDWAAAEKGFRRALELSPGYVHAHHWYAHYCMAVGRAEEAMAAGMRALDLDPLDLVVNVHMAWHYWLAREPDRALDQCSKVLEMEGNTLWARFFAGLAYEQKGMYDEAVGEFLAAADLSADTTFAAAGLGHACGLSGVTCKAADILSGLRGRPDEGYVPSYDRAMVHLGLGQAEQAFACLERAREERASWMAYLKVEPRLDPLRADPRFTELMRRVGLPQ